MQLPAKQTRPAAQLAMHFLAEKKTAQGLSVSFHIVRTQIYVSQCEMRHSNPVLQHGFFSAPFPVLSLFVRHSCFACLLALSVALFYVELRFFVACFLDLFHLPFFAFHVCRLIHKLTLCFVLHVVFKIFFGSSAVGDAISRQTYRPAAQLAMHFSAEKNLVCITGFECLISHWLT